MKRKLFSVVVMVTFLGSILILSGCIGGTTVVSTDDTTGGGEFNVTWANLTPGAELVYDRTVKPDGDFEGWKFIETVKVGEKVTFNNDPDAVEVAH